MNEIDTILEQAGERWRAAQPPAPLIDAAVLTGSSGRIRAGRSWVVGAVGLAAVLVVGVVGYQQGFLAGGPQGPGSGGRAECDITLPEPAFIAPKPYPATPPPNYQSAWYGTKDLWVMLDTNGEVWGHAPGHAEDPVTQKLFWWSAKLVPDEELQPDITVTGTRLDGPGHFTSGNPGTNAGADFGQAMLVGADFEDDGCWQITGEYRGAALSYVVWVGPE